MGFKLFKLNTEDILCATAISVATILLVIFMWHYISPLCRNTLPTEKKARKVSWMNEDRSDRPEKSVENKVKEEYALRSWLVRQSRDRFTASRPLVLPAQARIISKAGPPFPVPNFQTMSSPSLQPPSPVLPPYTSCWSTSDGSKSFPVPPGLSPLQPAFIPPPFPPLQAPLAACAGPPPGKRRFSALRSSIFNWIEKDLEAQRSRGRNRF